MPNTCNDIDKPIDGCAFVIWYKDSKWCHLADINCEFTSDLSAITWKNPNSKSSRALIIRCRAKNGFSCVTHH